MKEVQGFIVLLDISGYTKFVRSHNVRQVPVYGKHLRRLSEAHAEQVVTALLETLIGTMGDLLRVEKLEGDAVLFSAVPDNSDVFALPLVDRLQKVFPAFHERIHELAFCKTCLCDCCNQMGQLRVKGIAHFGSFLIKEVHGFRELAGQELIRAHRLLKNQVASDEYLMLTDDLVRLGEVRGALALKAHTESDPQLGATSVWVHYPPSHGALDEPRPDTYLQRLQKMRSFFNNPMDRQSLAIR
jgi:hypothetical protein